MVVALTALALVPTSGSAAPVVSDWTQYLHDNTRSGYTTDGAVTVANAPNLSARPNWPVNLGGQTISTQPLVVNGVVYSGSWDGNEYAISSSGSVIWKTALGITDPNNSACPYPGVGEGNESATSPSGSVFWKPALATPAPNTSACPYRVGVSSPAG